ncbi:MAG: FAD-dependent oxidoreductase [Micropepsaceae bacterium]
MAERIIIVGAGIAGLGAAMALARDGRDIVVLDRDPPPSADLETAFEAWERKGVTQLRHSHVFLGCLVSLIRKRHPRLHALLLQAGAREIGFADTLPVQLRKEYIADARDEDMAFLFSRRTTLEHVMRSYVMSLQGIEFETDARVKSLVTSRESGQITVKGVVVERDSDVPHEALADIVIDATGRNSLLTDALREQGAHIPEDRSPAGILYFTRHYRLKPGQEEPPRDAIPGAGDLGYIKFGVFAADNRHFSITLAVPEIETDLRTAALNPAVFDKICERIPGAGRWTSPERAEPVTKVFGMGNLQNVWRYFARDGQAAALNFFAVGDAAIRTNPLYGRGCSIAVSHAHILADVITEVIDPRARSIEFERRSRAAIRPFWDVIVKQDIGAIRRAKYEQQPGYKPRLKARLIKSFAEDAIGPATRSNLHVYRAIMKTFHMLEAPTEWLGRPSIIGRVLLTWIKPKSAKLDLYPPKLGPDRTEMLSALGLPKMGNAAQ